MPDELDLGALDEVQEITPDREVPCARLIGCAGTGKTFTLMARKRANIRDLLLTSTTGISAVNLGCATLHSTLKFFDVESMRDSFHTGSLSRHIHTNATEYNWLVVEEYSMLHDTQLDYLYQAMIEANRYVDMQKRPPMGILLVGDLAQLPPVKGEWCFRAECWPKFAENTTKLTKVWRQNDGPFLDALNLLRAGQGGQSAEVLIGAGIQWNTSKSMDFDGTTILPVNEEVDRFNWDALKRVAGEKFTVKSRRWGVQRGEWGEKKRTHEWGIPPSADFKIGAYVMILANSGADLNYANGDCGHIEGYNGREVAIHLVRGDRLVVVPPVVRGVEVRDRPESWDGDYIDPDDDFGEYIPQPHFRGKRAKYVLGQIEYLPIRLAYASTVHKSQSLTLDRVQVDFRHHFFGHPAMLYVALSRCRTLEGLRLVGQRERYIQQCNVDPNIAEWI